MIAYGLVQVMVVAPIYLRPIQSHQPFPFSAANCSLLGRMAVRINSPAIRTVPEIYCFIPFIGRCFYEVVCSTTKRF